MSVSTVSSAPTSMLDRAAMTSHYRLPSGNFQASFFAPPDLPTIERIVRGFVDVDGLEDVFMLDDVGRVLALRSLPGGSFAAPILALRRTGRAGRHVELHALCRADVLVSSPPS